ncbi:MFS transporter [Cupriavidus sp. 30B13]|uniref:MFS transporter n=1 Tax=Cupriavidus sp. 30B13 TaxID=3384241 RepID=UPI003B918317
MMMEGSHRTGDPVNNPAASSPLRAWLAVGSVTIGAFAFVTTEFLPVGLLPQVAAEFGVTPGTAGLMVTTPGILAAISAPGMMLGAGRIDRRLILLILSVLLLASTLISAFAPTFAVMLVGRALLGASLGGFWTLALAAAGRLVQPHEAPKATAMILAGVTCATVIGVPLGTFIAGLASWRASFMATGVLVAIALAAQAMLVPSLPSKAALRMADLFALLRQTHSRRSLIMVAFVFGAHFSSYTFIAPFLQQYADFSAQSITLVLLGFGIIGFVSNFAVSATVGRNLGASLAAMIVMLMIALLAMPALRQTGPAVVATVLAWGIAFGAIPLCLSVWIQRSTADLPEAGSALFVGIIQVAIAVGSSVGGGIVDHAGIPVDFGFGAVLALIGLALLGSFRAMGRDRAAAPAAASVIAPAPDCNC